MDIKKARASISDLYIKQQNEKRNWFRICVVEFVIIGVLALSLAITAKISKPYPWVVQVDEHGFEVAIGHAGEQKIDERVVISRIGRFIEATRTVLSDVKGEQALIKFAFASVPQSSKAFGTLEDYVNKHSPYQRALNGETVQITVTNILPKSDRTYQANWTETEMKNGVKVNEIDYTGLFVVDVSPTKEGNDVINNPLGVYITEYTFNANYIQK